MNLANMVEAEALLKLKDKIKKVFFYRICGTGMGACACLLKEAGFEVEGADQSFSPPMSTYLDSTGIPCHSLSDVDAEFLKKYDLIIVGNSVPRQSEHASLIESCGVRFTSFPTILGTYILKNKEVIGLSGTHGKTTTTYFLTLMLESLGEDTGYFIGGIIDGRPPSKIGKSKFFTIESDEYDSAYFQKYSKFRQYEIDTLVVTSLEFDHADIFADMEAIESEFESIIPNLNKPIIANDAYSSILKLQKKYDRNQWQIYGEQSDLGPKEIKVIDGRTHFKVTIASQEFDFETNIIGAHNILNITSAIFALVNYDFPIDKIQEATKELGLVKRRQEVRGNYNSSIVIDDFAHHPKAITLTTEAIRARFPNRRIITVFEPVSATARSSVFQKEFQKSLELSDKVLIAESGIKTTAKDGKNLDCSLLVKNLNELGVPAQTTNDLTELRTLIEEFNEENALLLILSNRTCIGLWESDFVKELS
jgi:UDP-N-acetylmuramate: L-alanyl-gamma-D-glutamyl-meso-diaminopimelate ligase